MAESLSGGGSAFSGGRIQQQARLVAALGHSVSPQIQIGQSRRCRKVSLAHGPPQPLGSFSAIARRALGAVQVPLGRGHLFRAASLTRDN